MRRVRCQDQLGTMTSRDTSFDGSARFAAWTLPQGRWPLSPASESDFLKQLGERVRTMRSLRGMSRRELARRSRISERYLAMIEAGRGNVSIMLLLRIAHAVRGD
jgi:XRE family aerobic/anaerobic benzoate catabolism transcriptional regulator